MATFNARICIRRGLASEFTSANPTLALGEIAYETDTRNIKVGDGATAWTALGYINPFRGGTAAAPTSNVALGDQAGDSMTSGVNNTCIGLGAGTNITDGTRNTAIGAGALQTVTSAGWNTAIGLSALAVSTGTGLTAVGANALDANTTGTENTALGRDALGANTTGANAVAVGNNAGHNFGTAALPNTDLVTSATGSIFIGRDARPGADSQSNQIVIGDQGRGNGSNTTTIGNSSTTGTFLLGKTTSTQTSATTNAVIPALQVNSQSSGTPALGIGTAIEFAAETAAGNTEIGARIDAITTDVTNNSEDFDLVFSMMRNGSLAEMLRMSHTAIAGQRTFTFTSDGGQNRSIAFVDTSREVRTVLNNGLTGIPSFGTASNHSLDLMTNYVNQVRIGTNGNVTINNGNLVMSTAGTGIDFSATANSSGTMTSELLSDYEEGTWTPTYSTDGTGFTTMTMDGGTVGRYTKIGRMVTVFAYLTTDNVDATGATGTVTVTGLPFTVSGSSGFFAGSIAFMRFFAASGFPCAVYAQTSTTYLKLEKRAASNGTTAFLAPADLVAGAINDQNQLMICLSYFV